ncbi:MAG: hypothetical protein Q8O30_05340, partial [Candidatus Omnitrophota bacterium]|nr:hypothetical protein [Candidatus Omnitrophota bacterium]
KREVFLKNKFDFSYPEDVIFSMALEEKGYRLLFEPSIKIRHINMDSRTFPCFIKNQLKIGGGSALTRRKTDKSFRIFLKFPFLIFIAPFFIVPQMGLTYLLRRDFEVFLFFLKYFPLFFIGNFFWAIGFFKEAIIKNDK